MVFSSLYFIFGFLPLFFAVYFLMPDARKNLWLLLGSLLFYWYGVRDCPYYLLLLLASLAVNYILGKKIARQTEPKRARRYLAAGLIYDFGWLFLFKYTGFFLENLARLSALAGQALPVPSFHPVLPLGISFYTFEITAYLIDLYYGRTEAETSFVRLGSYLCMFPHLTSGPILTYPPMKPQLEQRVHSLAHLDQGLRQFTIGLGLKVLLANQFGALWRELDTIGYESLSTPLAWLGIIGYSLQLYFDFYGYSLMACGLGSMMGFTLPENFRHPYTALSMTDFWRRWHITLGSWFRQYIYIPLGGNRCSPKRQLFNMLVVWMLTGLWHGASWNFVLWGGILFLILAAEKNGLLKHLQAHPRAARLYMCFLIPFTWLFFAITDFSQLGIYLERLFPFAGASRGAAYAGDFLKYIRLYGPAFLAGLLFCTKYPKNVYLKYRDSVFSALFLIGIFWICVYCMYRGMDDPFLYFRF